MARCWRTDANVFAVTMLLAATAGKPMLGKVESPVQKHPCSGVHPPGNSPYLAEMGGS
jgi:hypothetical protein